MIPQRKIETEKARIIKNCAKCGGASCASCQRYCSFIEEMAESGIPVDYWFREIGQWYGDSEFCDWLKANYLIRLEEIYAEGKVLCLSGHRGVGKTMVACNILKKALLIGYSSHYTSLVDAVDNLVSEDSHDYRRLLKMVDFLVIDEVDQRFFGTVNSRALYGNQFEGILRTRTQNRLPMIICTNAGDLEEIFAGEFLTSFKSLRAQFFTEKLIRGDDARIKEGI